MIFKKILLFLLLMLVMSLADVTGWILHSI